MNKYTYLIFIMVVYHITIYSENEYKEVDTNIVEVPNKSVELITEEKLQEIIENSKKAPVPQENIESKKEIIPVEKKYTGLENIELIDKLESTFDKYNFSTKNKDIHVGQINSNEFTSDRIIDNGEIGVGISYKEQKDNRGKPRTEDNGDWNYTPIYATGKYKISETEDNTKYLKINLGYSFKDIQKERNQYNHSDDDKIDGNMYYGIGGGIDYKDMSVGVIYQVNKNGIEEKKGHKDDSRVTFSVDYKLNF